MPRARHTRAVGQLIVAALCWSLGGLLIKSVGWSGWAVAGGRGLIAAAFLVCTHRDLRFHLSRDQVLGAVGYAACTVLFCAANKYTTAANAILLQYTAPVWVALFGAWVLGERADRQDWFAIGAVLAGLTLFFADSLDWSHAYGNLLGLLSGVAFAGMTLAMRRQKDGSPIESIILGNLLAFAAGLPAILRAPPLPERGWIALLLLGTIQLGFAYRLYAQAIREVTALEAVLLPVIEPILNPLWVLIALGERPRPLSLAGGALVLAAVTLRAARSIRRGLRAGVPPAAEVSTG